MEAESIQSLTPLLQEVDRWHEALLLLPLLVALEAVLSADNAIALAAISRRLHDRARQETALNLGLLLALVFRLGLILAAQWVLNFWPLQLAAAAYLLWLCGRHLVGLLEAEPGLEEPDASRSRDSDTAAGSGAHHPVGHSAVAAHPEVKLASVVATLAITDLAFSIDSVAAAVAVSDRLTLVIAGGVIGVIALRLTAELFIRWLEIFRHLETAGYLAVGLVGVRLLLRLAWPQLVPPEWMLLALVGGLFLWGFSVRQPPDEAPARTVGQTD
jgi:YkoY family integral membrane protein